MIIIKIKELGKEGIGKSLLVGDCWKNIIKEGCQK